MITFNKSALVVLGLLHLGIAHTVSATVCMKKSGALAIRSTCGAKETAVTPTMLGVTTTDGSAGAKGERGPKGEEGDAGTPGTAGPKGDAALPGGVFTYNIPEGFIGEASGDGRTIATLPLTGGRYLVMARFDVVNFGTPTFVRCFLDIGNYRAQMATTFIGHTATDSSGAVETMSFLLPIDAGTGLLVTVKCRPDSATGGNDKTYVESGVLTAVPTDAWVLR